MNLFDQIIAFGLFLTATCFLLGLLGIAADGWMKFRAWRKSDKWTRQNEEWKRWMTYKP